MTEKLYYSDSHLCCFNAEIKEITEYKNGFAVVLDKTAFFPGGGGQACDVGFINNIPIREVFENDGTIYHITDSSNGLFVDAVVACNVNSQIRFARMQAHSGEHIFSGAAHNLFGVENVGFHMNELVLTVDFDKFLTKEQLAVVEKKSNEIVYSDVSVTAEIVDNDKLNTLQYRSKLDLSENVRLVTIDGCDCCACCAPHVNSTGEVGIIKVLSSVRHRGGVRITLVCGAFALDNFVAEHNSLSVISDMLKVPISDALNGVNELFEKLSTEKSNSIKLKNKMFSYIYASLEFSESPILLFLTDFSPNELRELAEICKNKSSLLFAVFSGNDIDGYYYAVSSENVKLCNLSKLLKTRLNAKGGGADFMLQGKLIALQSEIKDFFDNAGNLLL